MITQERLKHVLNYDPETGIFTWLGIIKYNVTKGSKAGCAGSHYHHIGIDRANYYAHRLAWLFVTGRWPKKQIDHINGDGFDNRIKNLRESTHYENMRNRKKSKKTKTGFKGVVFEGNRFAAQIGYNHSVIYIGSYGTPEEAHKAYCKKADELFGEFANHG